MVFVKFHYTTSITNTMLEEIYFAGSMVISAQFNSILFITHHNFEDNRIVSSHPFSLGLTDSSDLVICDPFNTFKSVEFMFFLFRLVHSICVFNFIFAVHKSFFFHTNYINCYFFCQFGLNLLHKNIFNVITFAT